jgi:hypothetical protein
VEKLRQSDPLLADQLLRAATHVATEIMNAERVPPQARRTHLLGGLAATSEAMTLLRVAVDSRHCRWDSAKDTYYELSHTYLELIKRAATKRRGIAKKPRDGKRRAA